jgi:hypothetical protein
LVALMPASTQARWKKLFSGAYHAWAAIVLLVILVFFGHLCFMGVTAAAAPAGDHTVRFQDHNDIVYITERQYQTHCTLFWLMLGGIGSVYALGLVLKYGFGIEVSGDRARGDRSSGQCHSPGRDEEC